MAPKPKTKTNPRKQPRKIFNKILSHQVVDGFFKYTIEPVHNRKNEEVYASDFISKADLDLLYTYRAEVSNQIWDRRKRSYPISKVERERDVNGTTMFLCSYQGWDAIWNEEFTKQRLLDDGFGRLLARYEARKAANAPIQQVQAGAALRRQANRNRAQRRPVHVPQIPAQPAQQYNPWDEVMLEPPYNFRSEAPPANMTPDDRQRLAEYIEQAIKFTEHGRDHNLWSLPILRNQPTGNDRHPPAISSYEDRNHEAYRFPFTYPGFNPRYGRPRPGRYNEFDPQFQNLCMHLHQLLHLALEGRCHPMWYSEKPTRRQVQDARERIHNSFRDRRDTIDGLAPVPLDLMPIAWWELFGHGARFEGDARREDAEVFRDNVFP